jgi:hypothetical protein
MAVQLTQEDKTYILQKIKPLLQKGNVRKVISLLTQGDTGYGVHGRNILAWLIEHKVDILGQMDKIPSLMFRDTDISTLKVPENIKYIGDRAFAECQHLTSVTLSPGLLEIGAEAFLNSGIAKIDIPEGIEVLTTGTFKNCKNLSSVFLPDSLTLIQAGVFEGAYDGMTIYLNSRKGMPAYAQLRIPTSEVDWYKKHVQIKTA